MTQVQIIEKDGKPAFAVVPFDLWERLRELAEDAADTAAYRQVVAKQDRRLIPGQVAHAILAGDSPIRAWRKFRKLTIEALATAAGMSKPYLSQIETGERDGSDEARQRLAEALQVDVSALEL